MKLLLEKSIPLIKGSTEADAIVPSLNVGEYLLGGTMLTCRSCDKQSLPHLNKVRVLFDAYTMAGRLLLRSSVDSWRKLSSRVNRRAFLTRTVVTSKTGSLLSKPPRPHQFGLVKVMAVVTVFAFAGFKLGELFASSLEKYDIFVPDDDDDDD